VTDKVLLDYRDWLNGRRKAHRCRCNTCYSAYVKSGGEREGVSLIRPFRWYA
jgi:hypothetical protein